MPLVALLVLGSAGVMLLFQPQTSGSSAPKPLWSSVLQALAPTPQPRLLPTDMALDEAREVVLLSELDAGDQRWQPQAQPMLGGGTRYIYRQISGEPPLSLDQIKALMRRPPSFAPERRAIRELLLDLRRVGAAVVLGQPHKPGAAGEWDPRRMVVRIRPDVSAKGSREFFRVLNHEAIHVAQSCRNGSIRAQPLPLGLSRAVNARERRHLDGSIYADATPLVRALEEEAYANQHHLSLGRQLLQAQCRR